MKRGNDIEGEGSGVSPPKFVKKVKEYGTSGSKASYKANYFELKKAESFSLKQYHVGFSPDSEVTLTRKSIIRQNRELIGLGDCYLFDGQSLFTSTPITDQIVKGVNNGMPVELEIRRTGVISADNPQAYQIFNLIMRDSMAALRLQNIRRNYYDPQMKIQVKEANLELWPGYLTSIRSYEDERVLLNVEVIHKFMRNDTIYQISRSLMETARNDWREKLQREIVGSTVLTDYTNKTYTIDDIDFQLTPNSTFRDSRGNVTSYGDYYLNKYQIEIKDRDQFMLVSRARERDLRAGQPEHIYLIPELCRATGLTERMRTDFRLMQAISAYTRLNPEQRVESLNAFNSRLRGTEDSMKILKEWSMQLDRQLVDIEGRELAPELIIFGNDHKETPTAKAEWAMKNGVSMYAPVTCTRWVFLYPRELENESKNFKNALIEAARKMNYTIQDPLMRAIYDDRQESYIREIDEIATKNPKIIVIALPTNRADRYSSVKRRCMVDFGIPCQVVVKNKTMCHRNLHSIASKIVIQINCKLGGIPWMINLPIKGLMVVGFDVSIHPRDRTRSVGALVATMDLKRSSVFYSTTMEYRDGNEMVRNLNEYLIQALKKYKKICESLPDRIVFYRDGVGEGQIATVKAQEIDPINKSLQIIYAKENMVPKFAYIIVNKRSNARFFKKEGSSFVNPGPGTVFDRVVTIQDRNDFYLISQKVGQGTVAPTYYQVMHNTSELSIDKLEILSYKLCHLYFNWGGTVRLPCVSQFAKKLAYITSQSLQNRVHENLEETLYFL